MDLGIADQLKEVVRVLWVIQKSQPTLRDQFALQALRMGALSAKAAYEFADIALLARNRKEEG